MFKYDNFCFFRTYCCDWLLDEEIDDIEVGKIQIR